MTTPLRILIVADVSPLTIRGGAERVLWEHASRLAGRGHRVRVLSRSPIEATPKPVERCGVEITHFAYDRRTSLRSLLSSISGARRAAERLLREEPADILHFHQPLSARGVLASPLARTLPHLYTFHSSAPMEYASRQGMTSLHLGGPAGRAVQALLWVIERTCLQRVSRIHVLSDFSEALLWRLYRILSERIVKIPGGADVQRFRPAEDRDSIRHELDLPLGVPILLTIRNLEARMGLDTLIRAISLLRRTTPNFLLLIGGAGSLRSQLESLAASLGLASHIRFLGFIPDQDLPRYYQTADAFILPTQELEGFGLVTVEALSCGTPVLGTAVGATPELLYPLDPSLIFPDRQPEIIAKVIRLFLDKYVFNGTAAPLLRQTCHKYALSRYDWNLGVAGIEQVITQIVNTHSNSTGAQSPIPCPTCGWRRLHPDVVYCARRYLRCPKCGTGAIATLPSPQSLRGLYDISSLMPAHYEQPAGPRTHLFSAILERLAPLGVSGRILDIGCGEGQFLTGARQLGLGAFGTDLSLQACVTASRAGTPAVQADSLILPIRPQCVDTVSFINVIDQLADPFAALREAHRVLRDGGYVVIRVVNATFHRPWIRLLSSFGPLITWREWDRLPTLHLYAFTGSSLAYLAQRAGFDVIEIRNSPSVAKGLIWPRSSPQYSLVKILNRCVTLLASALGLLTGGRCLLAPSIELYARRSHTFSGDRP